EMGYEAQELGQPLPSAHHAPEAVPHAQICIYMPQLFFLQPKVRENARFLGFCFQHEG
ncbi:hypothetical protein L195_g061741, partial [Trifolium pratense]